MRSLSSIFTHLKWSSLSIEKSLIYSWMRKSFKSLKRLWLFLGRLSRNSTLMSSRMTDWCWLIKFRRKWMTKRSLMKPLYSTTSAMFTLRVSNGAMWLIFWDPKPILRIANLSTKLLHTWDKTWFTASKTTWEWTCKTPSTNSIDCSSSKITANSKNSRRRFWKRAANQIKSMIKI